MDKHQQLERRILDAALAKAAQIGVRFEVIESTTPVSMPRSCLEPSLINSVSVASLPAMALLKICAWADRNERTDLGSGFGLAERRED